MDGFLLDPQKLQKNIAKLDSLLNHTTDVLVKAEWQDRPFNIFDQPLCRDDAESEFNIYLSQYNMHAEAAQNGLDNVPFFRVDFCRVAYQMAIAYGCKTFDAPGVINARPMISDINDVYKIKKLENILEHGYYPELVRRMHVIEDRLGDVGFVPADTQSPIDVLTSIVDTEEVMCAMFEDPDALHYLLDILTESIAESVEGLRGEVKNWIGSGHDYPITKGIHLSDDNAAFLSPTAYREFAQPYSERLAQCFDGVTLHCCMRHFQCIEPMCNTKGLLGMDAQFNWHSDEEILPYIKGKGFLRQFWLPEGKNWVDFSKEIIDKTEGICGLMIEVGANTKQEAIDQALEIKEYAAKKGRIHE